MTRAAGNCPSCGGPVEWVSVASVQTVCPYCSSVLVRTDMDLRAVGVRSQVPPTVSPIQLGTRGVHDGRAFQVVGRLVYAYERGRWNEWHLSYDDGATGWLSDAQAELAITAPVAATGLPAASQLHPGTEVKAGGGRFTVSTLTRARYAGTEGELPFEKWSAGESTFVDLRGDGGRFGTLDYSESPPLLYVGRWTSADELKLTGLREPEAVRAAARTLNCPHCGGTVEVRAADYAVNVVCTHCRSVLDARTPALAVLREFHSRLQRKPLIPLGAAGTLDGEPCEVIGFQVRTIRADGRDYPWGEYLLFSPLRGFRYLTEYQGHWTLGATLRDVPKVTGARSASLDGRGFRHFQRAGAETVFALGEFPWEVRSGDKVTVSDYVAPPQMLSKEETEGEITWTLSRYLPGAEVWKAFRLPGAPPAVRGVYANQPGPGAGGRLWGVAVLLLAALVAGAIFRYSHAGSTRYDRRFEFVPGAAHAEVVGPLTLGGRTSNVEVRVRADLMNSWAYFDFTLADSAGHVSEFGREVSLYQGVEDGERWSEGDLEGTVRVPSVPPGRYWLRVEPQGELPYPYEVSVRRDVPWGWMYWMAALLLLLPPLWATVRAWAFETARWAESDYAGGA